MSWSTSSLKEQLKRLEEEKANLDLEDEVLAKEKELKQIRLRRWADKKFGFLIKLAKGVEKMESPSHIKKEETKVKGGKL